MWHWQGNIDQAVVGCGSAARNVRKHMDLSAAHWDADVLIWPEAALTCRDAKQAVGALHDQGKTTQTNVIIGMPDVQRRTGADPSSTVQAFGLADGDLPSITCAVWRIRATARLSARFNRIFDCRCR